MAASVNKVILVGNLGRDPETRKMQNGDKVINLSLATSMTWNNKQTGQRQERSEWHRVVIFNERLAEVAERFLHKGRKVYLEGEMRTRKWTDQQGMERYTTEVVIDRFRGELVILDNRQEGQAHTPLQQPSYGSGSGTSMSDVASTRPPAASSWGNDDDMPF